ncbi:glycosyl hydrolase 115 family protein [Natronospora cellulosivora (SeqCode)]
MILEKKENDNDFLLFDEKNIADIFIDSEDYWGVKRAVKDLQKDFTRVSNKTPEIKEERDKCSSETIIIGTIGKNKVIDKLIAEGKIDVEGIKGKWESFLIQVVDSPTGDIDKALIIAGSDKRGSIFGIYHLSQAIGVSPWYWWADVSSEEKSTMLLKKGKYKFGEPSVKYRGIFLNDEAPSLTTWVENNYDSFNHKFYEKVFELILRLKANYLWPAMWKPRVFNEEDPLNPKMADKYGVVMGTSHHEPMMRSWEEWGKVGTGEWNYNTNKDNIFSFWETGIERVKDFESVITVGMRGDGDEAMIEGGTVEENKNLLEKIIADQRKIIADKVNENVEQVPQLLALYKEVQSFYEAGMELPEDITLMLADDNFGNIRKLPAKKDRERTGGYGMYYHFDYVGGPRSYQWINTVPLQKIWEQMKMTYDFGVDRIWIVNVGDLKPMEFPIEFFLEMAWDIDKWNQDNISHFALQWVEKQFGEKYADEISNIILKYTKFNGRRKPEIVEEDTYSLINYREAERALSDFNQIVDKAEEIYDLLSDDKKDAFYQLILYPSRASRNIMKMHVYAGLNQLYAEQGRLIANDYAKLTKETFLAEAADTEYYNKELADAKWDGMMLQPHIGKSNWRGPEKNTMPEVTEVQVLDGSEMGVAIEGSKEIWPESDSECLLPEFSVYNDQAHYFEIFNKKADPFEFQIKTSESWIKLSQTSARVEKQVRIEVNIDWQNADIGEDITASIIVCGAGNEVEIKLTVFNPAEPKIKDLDDMTFIESNGYISIEAEHFSRKIEKENVKWIKVPDYGRTLSSMMILPSTSDSFSLDDAPSLEYKLFLFNPGEIKVRVYTTPSLNINRDRGLKYAISFDNQVKEVVDTFPKEYDATYDYPEWMNGVMDNAHINESIHNIEKAGYHTLKISLIDPGLVLEKIVLDMGGVKESYLGPPESNFKK